MLFQNARVGPWLVVVMLGSCVREQRVMRVGEDCVVRHQNGAASPLPFRTWHVVRGSSLSSDVELLEDGQPVGRVRRECLATELPEGPGRYVSIGGAGVFDEPMFGAASQMRLEPRQAVQVLGETGGFTLVASDTLVLGWVATALLTEKPRLPAEVALDVHWLLESGKRRASATFLTRLGPEALAGHEMREVVCRVAFGGLPDGAWVDQLAAQDCGNRPELTPIEGGKAPVLSCDAIGLESVSVSSPTAQAWACVTRSASARIYVRDHRGSTALLGEVIVPPVGMCPQARIMRLHTVGLGVCAQGVSSDTGCAEGSRDVSRALYCLPPPSSGGGHVAPTKVLLAYRHTETEQLSDEDCVSPVDALAGRPDDATLDQLDVGACTVTRQRVGASAQFHVVREDGDYVLCVRGAHQDSGPIDVAYRFLPGLVVEMEMWPRACDVDDAPSRP
ncbi:hypothetical protein ACFL6C_10060 [Myxococcota bacterium]